MEKLPYKKFWNNCHWNNCHWKKIQHADKIIGRAASDRKFAGVDFM
jgi:hypothetical protein